MLGYTLNLKNPKSLNEKAQWLKLHDRSPLHVTCADKFAVRDHIKEKIGEKYLIPLVLSTTDIEEIAPENLPDYPVIIKTNHNSGGVTIVKDKNTMDWLKIRDTLKEQLRSNYGDGKGEWQYKDIKPCIIIEKLLLDKSGNIPPDLKLHCFNGKLKFVQVDLDRAIDHKRNLYDENWSFLDCTWRYKNGRDIKKPKVFDEMVAVAEKLAQDFIYVRVDLYNLEDKIYFGELTFHTESGFGKFEPQEWDYKLGKMLQLPI
ncbi:glycosyl transferase [Flavobacteriaceae bacterium F89]|uniref:Glycosyl transferase n=1 Tax=Cerina litoralis TaxID=2874477 RepID=A0AAE3EVP3_9FLAO|nr:ATP-grasp fold amidoligase family protein [Cerina litoralis]MCG2461179.1 glycosyl transferase [Cerina litoralis]